MKSLEKGSFLFAENLTAESAKVAQSKQREQTRLRFLCASFDLFAVKSAGLSVPKPFQVTVIVEAKNRKFKLWKRLPYITSLYTH